MGELSKWLKQQANNEIWYDYYRKKECAKTNSFGHFTNQRFVQLKDKEIALKTNQLNRRKLNE